VDDRWRKSALTASTAPGACCESASFATDLRQRVEQRRLRTITAARRKSGHGLFYRLTASSSSLQCIESRLCVGWNVIVGARSSGSWQNPRLQPRPPFPAARRDQGVDMPKGLRSPSRFRPRALNRVPRQPPGFQRGSWPAVCSRDAVWSNVTLQSSGRWFHRRPRGHGDLNRFSPILLYVNLKR